MLGKDLANNTYDKLTETFFKLLKLCIGNPSTEDFPYMSEPEWEKLFLMARKQAIAGVLFRAIEKLPSDRKPSRNVILRWLVAAENIKQANTLINKTIPKVERMFKAAGFDGCVLKGQGIAQLYPMPELRTAGDIDLWVKGKRSHITNLVKRNCPKSHAVYHHIDGLEIDKVQVEVHFTPSYMSNPFANAKFQKWIDSLAENEFNHFIVIDGEKVHTPTLAFNRVFILHHIFRHFFYEGIGLRQMMDFYCVLKQGFTTEEQKETVSVYDNLNLRKFAGAAIYVLQEVFGLEKNYQIVEPNEKYGKILLKEILLCGNFGRCIDRPGAKENILQRGWRIIKRSFRFIELSPSEVFWQPYFKVMNNLLYVRRYSSDVQ